MARRMPVLHGLTWIPDYVKAEELVNDYNPWILLHRDRKMVSAERLAAFFKEFRKDYRGDICEAAEDFATFLEAKGYVVPFHAEGSIVVVKGFAALASDRLAGGA